MSLFADHNLPFAVALAVMFLLAVAQVFGLGELLGGDADGDAVLAAGLDADFDADGTPAGGFIDGLLSLFGIGRVPFMIWLALFLFTFAALGVSIQGFAENLTGGPLYVWLAALFAGGAALPVTGILARPLAFIIPKDETTAVSLATLVGRRATISDGVARAGSPARAQVRDHHGRAHNVMVVPHEADGEMHAGETVLLVRREDQLFVAAALEERRLAPTD